MLRYIDTHAHYDDEAFDADRDILLPRLHEENLDRIINIGCSVKSCLTSVSLAEKYDFIYAAVGIHPEHDGTQPEDYTDILRRLCGNRKVIAIGEIGLDYHYEGYRREEQIKLFEEQLTLAAELELPVIVHSRDAVKDTVDILKKHRPEGVVHCFSGSAETAREILGIGMYLGFTGAVTFKNAKRAAKVIEEVPADRFLLETDCPYMAPEPFRGKRCDSSMIQYTIRRIAELKGSSPEDIAAAADENAIRLFGLGSR